MQPKLSIVSNITDLNWFIIKLKVGRDKKLEKDEIAVSACIPSLLLLGK